MQYWAYIKLSHARWQRSYKRDIGAHSHELQTQFVQDALHSAVVELRVSEPDINQKDIEQGPLKVNQPDPGDDFRRI